MFGKMIDGLGLLLADNSDMRRPLKDRVRIWENKTEEEVINEIDLLSHAKSAWFFMSVIGWNIIALTGLGYVANKIWEDDFKMSLLRLFVILFTWVFLLFVVWLVASIFDEKAGFERWQKAFRSRGRVGRESVEDMEKLASFVKQYPEIADYKNRVLSKRQLRHEDILIMLELGRKNKHEEYYLEIKHK